MLDCPLVADFLVDRARCSGPHTTRQLAFGIRLPRVSRVIILGHRPDRLLKHTFRSGDAETLVFAQPAPGFEAGQHVECLDEVGMAISFGNRPNRICRSVCTNCACEAFRNGER